MANEGLGMIAKAFKEYAGRIEKDFKTLLERMDSLEGQMQHLEKPPADDGTKARDRTVREIVGHIHNYKASLHAQGKNDRVLVCDHLLEWINRGVEL